VEARRESEKEERFLVVRNARNVWPMKARRGQRDDAQCTPQSRGEDLALALGSGAGSLCLTLAEGACAGLREHRAKPRRGTVRDKGSEAGQE